MLNLRHIEVFHAVYQSGSISGAARLLGVSQPSVSKVLRHAESRLGFPLFELVKGRLQATDHAHALFSDAREVKARVDSMAQTARNLARADVGNLRIIVPHSLGLDAAPAAIARFIRRHPKVSVDIKTSHVEDMPAALHERQADIVISFDPLQHPSFRNEKLSSGEIVLLYHRDDLPNAPPVITADVVAPLRLIRVVNVGDLGAMINRHASDDGSATGVVEAQSYFVAGGLVRHRVGVAVMDSFTARGSLTPDLDYRPFEDRVTFDVFAVHREDQTPQKTHRAFLTCLRDVLDAPRGVATA